MPGGIIGTFLTRFQAWRKTSLRGPRSKCLGDHSSAHGPLIPASRKLFSIGVEQEMVRSDAGTSTSRL